MRKKTHTHKKKQRRNGACHDMATPKLSEAPLLGPFRAPKPLPILISSNVSPIRISSRGGVRSSIPHLRNRLRENVKCNSMNTPMACRVCTYRKQSFSCRTKKNARSEGVSHTFAWQRRISTKSSIFAKAAAYFCSCFEHKKKKGVSTYFG